MIFEVEKVIFEEEEGGVDLLGLQTKFERTYTDKIMPGITVLTRDVRYYGFICWAISRGINPTTARFRHLEQRLAFNLGRLYTHRSGGNNEKVTFLGIRKASKNLVSFKPPYYKTSIWSQYKSSIANLELISSSERSEFQWELTEKGLRFARIFNKAKYDTLEMKRCHIKDKGLQYVKRAFMSFLFDSQSEQCKIRKKYKTQLIKAAMDGNFYQKLAKSNKIILRNAALTAIFIKSATQALDQFYKSLPSTIATACTGRDIISELRSARKAFSKLNGHDKKLVMKELGEDIYHKNNEEMMKKIIKRHSQVKDKDKVILEQKNNRYKRTKAQKPDTVGFMGFRQGALLSLLTSLDRMEAKK